MRRSACAVLIGRLLGATLMVLAWTLAADPTWPLPVEAIEREQLERAAERDVELHRRLERPAELALTTVPGDPEARVLRWTPGWDRRSGRPSSGPWVVRVYGADLVPLQISPRILGRSWRLPASVHQLLLLADELHCRVEHADDPESASRLRTLAAAPPH